MRVEALTESASRRVGAVINTKTPSEHVSSHLKRCQNARKMPGNAARQPGKTFNHQSVKQSIIQLHFFLSPCSLMETRLVIVVVVVALHCQHSPRCIRRCQLLLLLLLQSTSLLASQSADQLGPLKS